MLYSAAVTFMLALGPELGYQFVLRNFTNSASMARPSLLAPVIRWGLSVLPYVMGLAAATMLTGVFVAYSLRVR